MPDIGRAVLTPARRDDGFTLVELLVVVVLLGVISVPLAHAVIGVIGRERDTSARLSLSHDAQISAAYFARDVAGVGLRDHAAVVDASGNLPMKTSVRLGAARDADGVVCGDATTPAAVLRMLSDAWEFSGGTGSVRTDVVAYLVTGTDLRRIKCTGSAVPSSDVVVAHNVDPATVSVTCSSTCDAAAVPQRITLSFTVTAPHADPFPITLSGQRRQT